MLVIAAPAPDATSTDAGTSHSFEGVDGGIVAPEMIGFALKNKAKVQLSNIKSKPTTKPTTTTSGKPSKKQVDHGRIQDAVYLIFRRKVEKEFLQDATVQQWMKSKDKLMKLYGEQRYRDLVKWFLADEAKIHQVEALEDNNSEYQVFIKLRNEFLRQSL